MKEVVFFSYTGTSEKIARHLASKLNCRINEIKPNRNRPYMEWLLLSFIPGLGVEISHRNVEGNEIILCFPKWTFNCPPVTSFLESGELRGRKIYIIVVYGGWRPEGYTSKYSEIAKKYGGEVVGWKIIRRRHVDEILKGDELFEEVKNAFKCAEGDRRPCRRKAHQKG